MSFPDLELVDDVLAPGTDLPYVAEATGIPDPGNNVVGLPFVGSGIPPGTIEPERLRIYFDPDPGRPAGGTASPGVTDLRFVSLSADKTQITLDFAQSGVGNARVVVELLHTLEGAGGTGPIMVGGTAAGSGAGPPSAFSCALAANGFSVSQEIGAELINPGFDATYVPSGTETFAELTDTDGNPAQNVLSLPNPVTMPFTYQENANLATTVFMLNANDGVNSDSDQVTVTWLPRLYWGVDSSGALSTEADIEALANNALKANKSLTFGFTTVGPQYVYYAFPLAAPYGPGAALDFQIGPFPGGFILQATVAVAANTPGAPSQSYQLWRSTNSLDTSVSGPLTLTVAA